MKNAKDADKVRHHRFLLIGDTGGGKTSQLLTLPGRKFVYIFDPNAISTLRGADIDYEEFLPDVADADFVPRSIKKGGKIERDRLSFNVEPEIYLDWAEDVNKRAKEGLFDDYDVVAIDSLTMWAISALERTRYLQDKIGAEDARTDYRLAGELESSAIGVLSSLPCTFVCMVHNEMVQDDKTGRLYKRITLHGGARTKVPIVFTDVFICFGEEQEDGEYRYFFQTRRDRENPVARSSFRGIDFIVDATIEDFTQPEKYGLGRLLAEEE